MRQLIFIAIFGLAALAGMAVVEAPKRVTAQAMPTPTLPAPSPSPAVSPT